MTDTPPDALADLPPSCKMTWLALRLLEQCDERPTQQRIAEACGYPDDTRTVRYALGRLTEADVVRSKPSVADARQDVYERVE